MPEIFFKPRGPQSLIDGKFAPNDNNDDDDNNDDNDDNDDGNDDDNNDNNNDNNNDDNDVATNDVCPLEILSVASACKKKK